VRILVTGATGLIGPPLITALRERGDEVVVLSRAPEAATRALGVEAFPWHATEEPAPAAALAGVDAVVHLAGAPVSQKWSDEGKQAIRASRETGTRNLVAGIAAAEPRPRVLVSASAVGYYGPTGDEVVSENTPPGTDFLADVVVRWEREANAAVELGVRVVIMRTGIVLDAGGGALKTMLTPFRLGVGGPVAGGQQYMPWIHAADVVGFYLAAIDDESWSGPYNVSAPEPVTNRVFSKALGHALHRPALAPVPAFAIKAMYGEMGQLVLTGQQAVPERALAAGLAFAHPDLDEALADLLAD
jgi:uncharacterized protein